MNDRAKAFLDASLRHAFVYRSGPGEDFTAKVVCKERKGGGELVLSKRWSKSRITGGEKKKIEGRYRKDKNADKYTTFVVSDGGLIEDTAIYDKGSLVGEEDPETILDLLDGAGKLYEVDREETERRMEREKEVSEDHIILTPEQMEIVSHLV